MFDRNALQALEMIVRGLDLLEHSSLTAGDFPVRSTVSGRAVAEVTWINGLATVTVPAGG